MKSTISEEQLEKFFVGLQAAISTKRNFDRGYDALALYCAFNASAKMLSKELNIEKLVKEIAFVNSNNFEDKQERINFLVGLLPTTNPGCCGSQLDTLTGEEISRYFEVKFNAYKK
jgi:hypothetical protein